MPGLRCLNAEHDDWRSPDGFILETGLRSLNIFHFHAALDAHVPELDGEFFNNVSVVSSDNNLLSTFYV